MNLIEIIEQYKHLLCFQDKEVAKKFLEDTVDPALHPHIIATFNEYGNLARSDGNTFYWRK
jgi:hypothetical protein